MADQILRRKYNSIPVQRAETKLKDKMLLEHSATIGKMILTPEEAEAVYQSSTSLKILKQIQSESLTPLLDGQIPTDLSVPPLFLGRFFHEIFAAMAKNRDDSEDMNFRRHLFYNAAVMYTVNSVRNNDRYQLRNEAAFVATCDDHTSRIFDRALQKDIPSDLLFFWNTLGRLCGLRVQDFKSVLYRQLFLIFYHEHFKIHPTVVACIAAGELIPYDIY